jgi:hypothetical protein
VSICSERRETVAALVSCVRSLVTWRSSCARRFQCPLWGMVSRAEAHGFDSRQLDCLDGSVCPSRWSARLRGSGAPARSVWGKVWKQPGLQTPCQVVKWLRRRVSGERNSVRYWLRRRRVSWLRSGRAKIATRASSRLHGRQHAGSLKPGLRKVLSPHRRRHRGHEASRAGADPTDNGERRTENGQRTTPLPLN